MYTRYSTTAENLDHAWLTNTSRHRSRHRTVVAACHTSMILARPVALTPTARRTLAAPRPARVQGSSCFRGRHHRCPQCTRSGCCSLANHGRPRACVAAIDSNRGVWEGASGKGSLGRGVWEKASGIPWDPRREGGLEKGVWETVSGRGRLGMDVWEQASGKVFGHVRRRAPTLFRVGATRRRPSWGHLKIPSTRLSFPYLSPRQGDYTRGRAATPSSFHPAGSTPLTCGGAGANGTAFA